MNRTTAATTNNRRGDQRNQIKGMTQMAFFAAVIVLMAFVPFLGYIPLGFTRATIIHVPVIIGSLMLGPKKGSGAGICLRAHQLYQQYHESHGNVLRIYPLLFPG